MARGMLTGKLDLKNLPENDFRKGGHNPQFNEDNVEGVSPPVTCLLLSVTRHCHNNPKQLPLKRLLADARLLRTDPQDYPICVSWIQSTVPTN